MYDMYEVHVQHKAVGVQENLGDEARKTFAWERKSGSIWHTRTHKTRDMQGT